MRLKEYYGQNEIQEDNRYIFTLTPPEFEGLYKNFIKKPIEEFKFDGGKVTCESHFDFKAGVDKLDETLKSIQKACIVIANITDLKPDVMFELGVALMKKGRVIPIAETSFGKAPDLPFDISKLGVEYYDLDNLDVFSRKLVNLVKRLIPTDHISLAPRLSVLMGKVLKQRRERDYEMAFVLFREMDKLEPKNWYIYKEWAITHEYNKNYEEAISMLKQALEFATTDRQKSEIHTALGVVYRKSKMEEEALASFQQAENLYRDDADLYDKWAFLFHTMRNYQEAMNKMMRALKIDPSNREFIWKLEYYTKRFTEPNYNIGLRNWLAIKGEEKQTKDRCHKTLPSKVMETEQEDYLRFKKMHSTQEVLAGTIIQINPRLGILVRLDPNITGSISPGTLPGNFDINQKFQVGQKITVIYKSYNDEKCQIILDIANELASSKEPSPPKIYSESEVTSTPIGDDERMKRQDKEIEAFLEKEEDNLKKIVYDEFKKLDKGEIRLYSPKEMRVGISYYVLALIIRDIVKKNIEDRIEKDLEVYITKGLKGRVDPQIKENIEISSVMKAVLSGDDFKIDLPSGAEEQIIKPTGYTTWIWNVKPLKAGRKVIHLSILVILYIEKR